MFAAQDLILFYVFFEAMLIPLYVLIGVWGGDGRQGATLKFIVYTMAGSLLMLVSIIALGLAEGDVRHDASSRRSNNPAIFLGFMVAFAVKAPMWPFHGWLPDAYREAPPEVAALLSGVISKTATYGMIRIVLPFFPLVVADWQPVVLTLAAIGLVYGSLLAFRAPDIRGVIAYSSLAQMSLIVFGVFAVNVSGLDGALLQMIVHGLVSASFFLLAGIGRAAHRHRRPRAPRRHGARAAAARLALHHRRRDRARRAVLGRVRRRVPDPERRLHARLGLGGRRRRLDRARGHVRAAASSRPCSTASPARP